MIHNGIEYGLMQAYAEGFELMHASPYKVDSRRRRRAVESGLRRSLVAAGIAARALAEDGELSSAEGLRRGLWRRTLDDRRSIDRSVPLPVITAALYTRFRSPLGHTRSPNGCSPRCAIQFAATVKKTS